MHNNPFTRTTDPRSSSALPRGHGSACFCAVHLGRDRGAGGAGGAADPRRRLRHQHPRHAAHLGLRRGSQRPVSLTGDFYFVDIYH